MPDYRLEGLSSRSFEQLTQTLAQEHLGVGITILGDGPDGAREAEFRGKFRLPNLSEELEGHVIVQAKFLQTPNAKPKQNTEWLRDQIETEMKKFCHRAKKTKKLIPAPDYYILSTNVKNSGVRQKGGKDRIASLMNAYQIKLGWTRWILWDANEISRMLDRSREIRTSYAAWITPGDVLMEMLNSISNSRSDFKRIMISRIQEDFCSAQYAKLRQAGHGNEERTPLSKLFVDLPITPIQTLEPPKENIEKLNGKSVSQLKLSMFLSTLFSKGDARLTPQEIDNSSLNSKIKTSVAVSGHLECEKPNRVSERSGDGPNFASTSVDCTRAGGLEKLWRFQEFATNRIVLLGGPGQGKTTLGQFACQLYRAALLYECNSPLTPETKDALSDLKHQCPSNIPLPKSRRYPVWIDLKEVAKWLSDISTETTPSLLSFIAEKLGPSIAFSELEKWLTLYPWFIVFDGLDEVPASSGRDRVLKCIQGLVIHANGLGSDLLVLCTTRPQGYSKDFDERYYNHQWLAPLSNERALSYGEKVLNARHGEIGDDRRTFGERLKQAAANETTARVMRSPLQVTIMTALVERVGRPPEQRWKLFREYYAVIYERERERGTAWSEALLRYDTEVDAIHRRIGWRLQVRSENGAKSDACLTSQEFNEEVNEELHREGHTGDDLKKLVHMLGNAATERLVFLVAVGSDEVGFEIRSLQEFMAADHLFKDGDADTAHRLARIAPIAYWKNVFLFGAGRVFAEKRHLRENLLGLLHQLNEDERQPAAKFTLCGSVLAIDLLEDGSASHIPATRDALMRNACRVLDVALNEEHVRLAKLGSRGSSAVLREELLRRLTGNDHEAKNGALTCTLLMSESNDWAADMIKQYWPTDHGLIQSIIFQYSPEKIFARNFNLLETYVAETSPYENPYFLFRKNGKAASDAFKNATAVIRFIHQSSNLLSRFCDQDGNPLPVRLYLKTIFSSTVTKPPTSFPDFNPQTHPDWHLSVAHVRFLANPSAGTLAEILEYLSTHYSFPVIETRTHELPWVLALALQDCRKNSDVAVIASRVRSGDFGDTEEWQNLENNWSKREITPEDVILAIEQTKPSDTSSEISQKNNLGDFLNKNARTHIILGNIYASHGTNISENKKQPKALSSFLAHIIPRAPKFALKLIEATIWCTESPKFTISTALEIAKSAGNPRFLVSQNWLEARLIEEDLNQDIVRDLNQLGLSITELASFGEFSEDTSKSVAALFAIIKKNPGKPGLWRILSLLPTAATFAEYSDALEYIPASTDEMSAEDRLALKISALAWNEQNATNLAESIWESFSLRKDLLIRLTGTLAQVVQSNYSIEALPVALLAKIPKTDWPNRQMIISMLRNLHTRRSSGFTEIDDKPTQTI